MQTEIITTDEQTIILITADTDEVPNDRDEEIAQDNEMYTRAAAVARENDLDPTDGEFEAGAPVDRQFGIEKAWELRFSK